MQSQFNDLLSIPYRLHAVFIHRGYVNSGHYWIYIYDFSKKIWRKYNDGYVTEVKDVREIFERDSESRPSTPYFLVYIQDNLKDELVDPVCRDISESTQDPQDADMLDFIDNAQEPPNLVDGLMTKTQYQEDSFQAIGTWDSASNLAAAW